MSSSLDDIKSASNRRRLTSGASLKPSVLLEQARKKDSALTLEEYTAARIVASEHSRGTAQEMACIVDAAVNNASESGVSLHEYATGGRDVYGIQQRPRPVATRQHPSYRHVAAARAVLSGGLGGISNGAVRYFDPRTQDRLHRAWKRGEGGGRVHSCPALGVLERWAFNRPKSDVEHENGKTYSCSPSGQPASEPNGPRPEEWVGPIDGVDAYRLMLMRPATYGINHTNLYQAARELILRRSGVPAIIDSQPARLVALLLLSRIAG